MRARRALLAALAGGALLLPACSGTNDEEAAQAPKVELSGRPDTWPLTGLEVKDGDAVRSHPVLVLKLDNTPSSDPQVGLSSADLVVEELVEGGVTRLAAFYYSKIPGDVGPVRSMRASDIGIVSPVDATLVTSGAAAVTISRLKTAGVRYVSDGGPGFFREDTRAAPYNLFTNLRDVVKATSGKRRRPVDYLPFGPAADLPRGKPARDLDARFSSGHTTSWSYARGRYVGDNGYAAEGDDFRADSVLVLRVAVTDAGYLDPAGNTVPETVLEGSGEAVLFHGGRAVPATWKKGALDAPIKLTTKAGALEVPPGHTWIELVPADGGTSPTASSGTAGQRGAGHSSVGSPVGIATPFSARDWNPAMMKPMAISTRSAAAIPSSAPATDSPAADMAPKKTRAKVCTMSSSSSHLPATSTERRMSTTLANVERSSCSR